MEMRTRAQGRESASSVVAKGTFAKAAPGEDVTVTFLYLFLSDGEGHDGYLKVSLGDDPDIDEGNLVELARVYPPPPGRPGSAGSGQWAVFHGTFPAGGLSFVRGTYVELELIGRGAAIWIDEWDPVACGTQCGSFSGLEGVEGDLDYLYLLSEFGKPASAGGGNWCADSRFNGDGVIDEADLLGFDAYYDDLDGVLALCGNGQPPSTAAPHPATPVTSVPSDTLLVAGKDVGGEDLLYSIDSSGRCVSEPETPASAPRADGKYRANGRLVQDRSGRLFQLHSRQGLIRLQDAANVIPPGVVPCQDAGGPCSVNSLVYVGITDVKDGKPVGVPINDVAFDPDDANVVYVVPVWVAPGAPGSPEPYKAAARLRLDSNLTPSSPPYQVERLYGSRPVSGDRCCTADPCSTSPCDVHRLWEVEVDRFGTLFVVSTDVQHEDNSWLLVYDKNSGVRVGCTTEPAGCPLPTGPIALTVSSDGNDLYFGTSPEDADEYAAPLYRASIQRSEGAVSLDPPQMTTLRNLRHITAIVEEPDSKQPWVVGFSAPSYDFDHVPTHAGLFTDPRMAIVPPDATEAWASSIGCQGFALPLSAIRVGSLCSGTGDADGDGDVDAVDAEQFVHCLGGPNAPSSDPKCLPHGPRSADLDCNGRVDLKDFARLQCRFTGNVRR
jgi:hypothetical protein